MVSYKVNNEHGEQANFTQAALLELLFKAALDKSKVEERKGTTELVGLLGQILMSTKTLITSSLIDMLLIAFNVGFYYARFLYLNKVEIIESKEDIDAG